MSIEEIGYWSACFGIIKVIKNVVCQDRETDYSYKISDIPKSKQLTKY